jgi:hypothetical protein
MANDIEIDSDSIRVPALATATATTTTTTTSHHSASNKIAVDTTELQGSSHFFETVTAAPLDPWSKRSLQLYAILFVAALNATASGFDGVGWPIRPHLDRYSHS